jgi:hypothetical protein
MMMKRRKLPSFNVYDCPIASCVKIYEGWLTQVFGFGSLLMPAFLSR